MADHVNKDIEMTANGGGGAGAAAAANGVPTQPPKRRKRRKACVACLACACVALVAVALVITILALTVFKARDPKIRVQRTVLQDLSAGVVLNIPPEAYINVTLALQVSVENPNRVGFSYSASEARIQYYGDQVGTVPIQEGRIGARQTKELGALLRLQADRLLASRHLLPDILAGSLPFTSSTSLSGRVSILHLFSRHVDTSSTCQFVITLANQSVTNTCQYDVHI